MELEFYGLLDRMMLSYTHERIGRALLQRACRAGSRRELQPAVAQARALVFEIGSTTPFLTDEFQDLRFIITDRIVHGSPVWAAVDGEYFMYRNTEHVMMVSDGSASVEGSELGHIHNTKAFTDGYPYVAPMDSPSDKDK